MRNYWWKSLALSLGLLAPGVHAADPASPAALDRPVATASTTPGVALERPVPATLGRPVAGITSPTWQPAPLPILDAQVRPTAFEGTFKLLRGQSGDAGIGQPLPVGPPAMNPNVALHSWRKSGDDSAPETAPPPTKITPVPNDASAFLSHMTHAGTDIGDACPSCGVNCCDNGCVCPGNRWYASAEYLLWWFKGQPVPPLVTSGALGDPIPGALGNPGTTVLFGGRDLGNGAHSGGRFMLGYWFFDDHCLGLDGGYFFVSPRATNFSATSSGTPILARPFIDAATGRETVELVAGPNVLAGTISVQTRSSMWGAEGNLRSTICCGCDWFVDLLAGFRTMGLDEDLIVHEQLQVLRAPGGAFDVVDHFQAKNRFYGGQIGAEWQCRKGRWDLDIKSKLAIGGTQQMVTISGADQITDAAGGVRSFNGGLFAQQSNIGTYTRSRFTFVSDVGFTVGYQCTEHLRCFTGYNFIYWSSVARPAAQIDRTVNANQIAPPVPGGPARPAFTFNGSDFWAQGLNVGLEYKW
jgi:hypothetical protein